MDRPLDGVHGGAGGEEDGLPGRERVGVVSCQRMREASGCAGRGVSLTAGEDVKGDGVGLTGYGSPSQDLFSHGAHSRKVFHICE